MGEEERDVFVYGSTELGRRVVVVDTSGCEK
jgi:hypothetical protein